MPSYSYGVPTAHWRLAALVGALLVSFGNLALVFLLIFGWGIRDATHPDWGALILSAYAFVCLALGMSRKALVVDGLIYRVTEIFFASAMGVGLSVLAHVGMPSVVGFSFPAFFVGSLLLSIFEYFALTFLMQDDAVPTRLKSF